MKDDLLTPAELKQHALQFVEVMKQARRKGGRNRMAKAKAEGKLMDHIHHMVAMRQAKRQARKGEQ